MFQVPGIIWCNCSSDFSTSNIASYLWIPLIKHGRRKRHSDTIPPRYVRSSSTATSLCSLSWRHATMVIFRMVIHLLGGEHDSLWLQQLPWEPTRFSYLGVMTVMTDISTTQLTWSYLLVCYNSLTDASNPIIRRFGRWISLLLQIFTVRVSCSGSQRTKIKQNKTSLKVGKYSSKPFPRNKLDIKLAKSWIHAQKLDDPPFKHLPKTSLFFLHNPNLQCFPPAT